MFLMAFSAVSSMVVSAPRSSRCRSPRRWRCGAVRRIAGGSRGRARCSRYRRPGAPSGPRRPHPVPVRERYRECHRRPAGRRGRVAGCRQSGPGCSRRRAAEAASGPGPPGPGGALGSGPSRFWKRWLVFLKSGMKLRASLARPVNSSRAISILGPRRSNFSSFSKARTSRSRDCCALASTPEAGVSKLRRRDRRDAGNLRIRRPELAARGRAVRLRRVWGGSRWPRRRSRSLL